MSSDRWLNRRPLALHLVGRRAKVFSHFGFAHHDDQLYHKGDSFAAEKPQVWSLKNAIEAAGNY